METAEHLGQQHDHLGFFLFLAFAVHTMLVLGVGFTVSEDPTASPQLEVTIAQTQSEVAPDDAKFIAQANQRGSGTEADRAEITTRHQAQFRDRRIQQPGAAPETTEVAPQPETASLVTTIGEARNQVFVHEEEPLPEPVPSTGIDPALRELDENIASLEARLDEQQQAYAELPRVRRLTSLSARAATDAAYLHAWRSKVEAVGNRYYPAASSRYGIYGDLRLLVAVRYDGSIENIEVLSSSGHAVLDEAAVRIVRMAAPFQPFPSDLRATTDVLEIIRTWKFSKNRLSSVQG